MPLSAPRFPPDCPPFRAAMLKCFAAPLFADFAGLIQTKEWGFFRPLAPFYFLFEAPYSTAVSSWFLVALGSSQTVAVQTPTSFFHPLPESSLLLWRHRFALATFYLCSVL